MDTRSIHALPAYGRDYKNKAEALHDWIEGKDFRDGLTGQYLSVRDVPGREVWLRYARHTKLVKAQ